MLRREAARVDPDFANRRGKRYILISGLRGARNFILDLPDGSRQLSEAILLGEGYPTPRHYWLFRNVVYSTIHSLEAEDVTALASAEQMRAKSKLAAARAWLDVAEEPEGRTPIPDEVKILIWQREGGRCVRCRSDSDLEFDHIIPRAMGGSSTARNLQLLCANCNREKGANLV